MEFWDELTLLYKLWVKSYYILMLDVNKHFTKSYRKMKNWLRCLLSRDRDRKRTEEGKKLNQNKCVSSQNIRMRKEEGATVGVCRPFCSLPFLSGPLRYRPDRQCSSMETFSVQQESPINYRKCPTNENATKRRRFLHKSFQIHLHWLSKTDEPQMKLIRCRWVWEQTY